MPVDHIVVLPALDGPGPDAGERSSRRVGDLARGVLEAFPQEGVALLLVGGGELLVHDARRVMGSDGGLRDLETAPEVLAAITHRGQSPRVQADQLTGRAGALAAVILQHRPALRFVVVTVPSAADVPALTAISAGLGAALATVEEPIVVVALGDLGPPDPAGDGARERSLAAAIDGTDPAAQAALRPADRGEGEGWAPVAVAVTIAHAAAIELRLLGTGTVDGAFRAVACGP